MLKNHVRKKFPYKLPLSSKKQLARIEEDNFFGYAQCDLEVLHIVNDEEFRERFANFPPIFKINEVRRKNIGKFMLEYAEKKRVIAKTNVIFELQIK